MSDPNVIHEHKNGLAVSGENGLPHHLAPSGNCHGNINHHEESPRPTANGHVDHSATNGAVAKGTSFTPIAICGMACRLPGNIGSPKAMWEFLAAGKDARSEVPNTRWSADAWYSPVKKKGTSRTQHGYFLGENVDLAAFDATAFPMPRGEIERMDPQQRLLLEVVHECLEDSGEVNWKGSSTGVYVGCFGQDWYDLQTRDQLKYSNYQITGSHDFMVSERISHELDLHGPCLTIRTACSSSMIALNDACMAIMKGDCKAAIVGGTSLHLSPATVTSLSENGVFSPDGSCKTFSQHANGFARGEGIVAIHIKTLDDAIRDGNAVRAVISGIATNFDGKTATMGRPHAPTQESNIRRAYEVAGISNIWETGLFECHGTGTAAGDPVETAALAAVFGDTGIHISSLKPNLGHAEGAAGICGIMKSVLALQNETIPPNIKAWPLSQKIPFEKAKLSVASKCLPWPVDRCKRVSVNSFGIAGANGHAIIDSAGNYGVSHGHTDRGETSLMPSLFVYSAHSTGSLERMAQNLQMFLETTTESFTDVSYTLANKRQHLAHRSFLIATKSGVTNIKTKSTSDGSTPHSLVMVFTGQGAQWPQMGRDLIQWNKTFGETIKVIDSELHLLGADWAVGEELRKNSRSTRINNAEFSQPLCTAIQLALVDTLESAGLRPQAVIGHSSGEIAASYAAGALTLSEAIAVAYHRGQAAEQQTKRGAMAAVGMSLADVQEYLIPGVVVACDNAHKSVTLSGDIDGISSVLASIKSAQPGSPTTMLKVDRAYHSHHMVDVGEAYYQALVKSGVVGSEPTIPFFSSVRGYQLGHTGKRHHFGPRYWQENLESPVLFKSAMLQLLQHRDTANPVLLEIGPHPALEGPVRQILTNESRKGSQVSTLVRRQNAVESFLTAIGHLWTHRFDVDFSALTPTGRTLNDLPCYPWDHQKTYWYESRVSREWRLGEHPYHDLLGRKLPESTALAPTWRNLLHLENVPWISDHRIENDIVFPASGYIAMAIEGMRQISPDMHSVHLRSVKVNSALPISPDSPTELVTGFHRHRLTDSLDSEWWDFSITSFNGNIWTRHCTGQVRADHHDLSPIAPALTSTSLPRKVDSRKWYDAVHRQQLSYGHHFTSMHNLTASVSGPGEASATLRNNWHGDEANYLLHPVIIDAFFQLLSAAAYGGQSHAYRRLVPMGVEQMSVCFFNADELQLCTARDVSQDGSEVSGRGQCIADSKVVGSCSGLQLTLFEGADSLTPTEFPLTARSEWVTHVDYSNTASQFIVRSADPEQSDLFQNLVCTALRCAQEKVRGCHPEKEHLKAYKAWLEDQKTSPDVHIQKFGLIDTVQSIASELSSSPFAVQAEAVASVCAHMDAVLAESRNDYDAVALGNLLEAVSRSLTDHDGSKFYHQLGLFKPNMRILELRAGSGARTVDILRSLRHDKGQKLFARYVIADASTGLLDVAKTRLQEEDGLEYACLDVEKDLFSQDFENEEFDLILAIGVLSSCKNVGRCLSNLRKLLSPKGRVLIQEPRPGSTWTKFVLGIQASWWLGQEDARIDDPHLSEERLAAELRSADLNDIQTCRTGRVTTVVAKASYKTATPQKVTVLCEQCTPETDAICARLQAQGCDVVQTNMEDAPNTNNDIIVALLDLSNPFGWDFTSDRLKLLQKLALGLQNRSVLWITRQSQSGVLNPRYSPIIGLARTIRTELAADFATCEVDDLMSSGNADAFINVFESFRDRRYDGALGPEFEYSISNGTVLVNRFFPFDLDPEVQASQPASEASLTMGKVGRPGTLSWSAEQAVLPQDDEVAIEIQAAGLNFRDVLVATGHLHLPKVQFGYEASGVVTSLGPAVTKFSVGDRVMLVGHKTLASTVVQSQMLCETIPASLDMLQAATTPLAYLTAIYGLIDIGRLECEQSVLIHSAAGGVGIAAIRIAQVLNAKIYASVGSAEKRKYLMENFGIPEERIFDSRSASFAAEVMSMTGGRGVDVALNSLSGELLHATWSCIAKWGTMVEIGKRDLLDSGKLDMRAFSDNRNYCCIDIDQMIRERPKLTERLLRRLAGYFNDQKLTPIPLARVFPATQAIEAFRYMQQGKHIGKIVLEVRGGANNNILLDDIEQPKKQTFKFDDSAAYLLVGGFGGLGRSVARYMVLQGARNLIILSRTAGKEHSQHRDYIAEIEAMGATVQCVKGDVAEPAAVQQALNEAQVPVKGIMNLTLGLADNAFERMTIDEWDLAVRPKVNGTWNILEVIKSRGLQLDFFILISSLSGIVGLTGQANYSSANTFVDAFSAYSTAEGVPCVAITSGVMEDIGAMSANPEILRRLQGSGWRLNNESELLETVDSAVQLCLQHKSNTPGAHSSIRTNKAQFIFGLCPTVPLNRPESYTNLRSDVRMAVYHNSKRQTTTAGVGDTSLRKLLGTATTNPSVLASETSIDLLAMEIGKKLCSLLLLPEDKLNPSMRTSDMGLDSMVAVEMGAWWKVTFGVELSTLEVVNIGTLHGLGKRAADDLTRLYSESATIAKSID